MLTFESLIKYHVSHRICVVFLYSELSDIEDSSITDNREEKLGSTKGNVYQVTQSLYRKF